MRLDKYLVENFNITRSRAADLIKLGSVSVNGEVVKKTAKIIAKHDKVEINDILKYVSRAGIKLEAAIKHFNLDFNNKKVLDVGSSTGGFTEVSLNFGAKLVYAYDVGTDQMAEELKKDERVKLFEQTNILDVVPNSVDICLIDVSFTSIRPIVKHLKTVSKLYIMLFKPQFEVGSKHIYGGIVKNEKLIGEAIEDFKEFLKNEGFNIRGIMKADIKGKKGNQEYIFIGEKNARID